jgi:RNA polymerase sigma factor (sigma-70 family)|tara:strand:- start:3745 stop:5025 length:1281 start_codon:yes stop_codon:yes gene_type:complete
VSTKLTYSDSKNIEHLFRQQSGKMFSILIRLFGFENSSLIEDIIQETFLSAMKTWSAKGVPENPEAWLMQVSKNKLINDLKKKSNRARLNEQYAGERLEEKVEELYLDKEIKDSQLRVLFACCNPFLSKKEQIMLTLKILSGFNNTEIANALLSTPEAVKKAIYRAKSSLLKQQVNLNTPHIHEAAQRIDMVHRIIYLIFNEGYKSTSGNEVINEDLCFEASRLAVLVSSIKGNHQPETYALLALIYFSMARFPSRLNADGEMIELELQDRTKWDKKLIQAATAFLAKSRNTGTITSYHLEATISSIHCMAESFESTDWESITVCYDKLLELEDNPVIRINRAIAISKWKGPELGAKQLDKIENIISKPIKQLFYAAKAAMFFQEKKYEMAKTYYQVAMDHSKHEMDKKFLAKKIQLCNTNNIGLN